MVTYSPALGLTLQDDGSNPNTWGDVANVVFGLIEQAIAGYLAVTISTGTITLSTTNGASNQARNAVIQFNGTLSGDVIIVIPNENKVYLFNNATSGAFTVTVQTASPSTALVLPQGGVALCYCDGSNNVYSASGDASTLGGIVAAFYARLDTSVNADTPGTAPAAEFYNQMSSPFFVETYAGSVALNAANGNSQYIVLTGNLTLGVPTNPIDGQSITLILAQDSGGGHITSWNAVFAFPNGSNTVDTSANGVTVINMVYSSHFTSWICKVPTTGYNSASAAFAINIEQNTYSFNLLAQMGGTVSSPVNVTITVGRGAIVSSLTPLLPAMDLSGMPSGSVINLINLGYIQGAGGYGGDGGWQIMTGSGGDQTGEDAQDGGNGGIAVQCSGSGTTTNVTNAAGYIWGGGGGGGGGGVGSANSGASSLVANAGGGGCGAGGNPRFGRGARAINADTGTHSAISGLVSQVGTTAAANAFGVGGAGAEAGAGMDGGDGGAGGNWGAAGTAGGSPAGTFQIAGGAAGTAGNAIAKNSSTVNVISGGGSPHTIGTVS
jgi:hypothetical protein